MGRILNGKYKGIIISVALFLLLDASVLMMNFYISFEIADDAFEVNLAGRQRMLSQRMMKAMLDSKVSINDHDELTRALDELQSTTNLFDTTLHAFDVGGETKGAQGESVQLSAVQSMPGRAAINEAKVIWVQYKERVDALLAIDRNDVDLVNGYLALAIGYGKKTNLDLLVLMNKLTVDLEQVASSKATGLRVIQTVGITLAVINFFIILFHFIRQLKEGDEKIDLARQETQEILNTVNEGLFLLDEKLTIGDQHSRALLEIFQQDKLAGESFYDVMHSLVSEKDLHTSESYIRLLFKPNVKENLTLDLNPLNEIEIHIGKQDGNYQSKYLSFGFKRVYEGKRIAHILVTVRDITAQIHLTKELEKTRNQSEQQLELLSNIIHTNEDVLKMFLDNAYSTFNRINLELRSPAKNTKQFKDKLSNIYAAIHNFKGEASAIKLSQFVDMAHTFEDRIDVMRHQESLTGTDFLGLAVQLDRLIGYCQSVQALATKLNGIGQLMQVRNSENRTDNAISPSSTAASSWQHLQTLANEIATRQAKSVEVVTSGLAEQSTHDELTSLINTLSIQLIRNAVSHGIETMADREIGAKTTTGRIDIRLVRRDNGSLEYTFKDDGAGFDYDRIREKALVIGMITSAEAEVFNHRELVSLIFREGFSTKEDVDEDAGRGVGMYAVMDAVQKANGKIAIASKRGQGCTFTITLPHLGRVEHAA